MADFKNKTVFVTGASSGIGEELSRQFYQLHANVFMTARRVDRLKTIANQLNPDGDRVAFIKADVTNPEDLREAVKKCTDHFHSLDIVIANAGFGVAGNVSDLTVEDYRRQFETNVFGVLNTVYAAQESLEKSRGQIVILGSVAGFVPLPGNSPYTMSKFSVRALAKALQYEWKNKGIKVTHLVPGFVDSDIRRIDNLGQLKQDHPDPIPSWIRVSTADAAKEMIRAIQKKKNEQVITGHGKAIQFMNQYFPKLIPWIIGTFGLKSRPEPQ